MLHKLPISLYTLDTGFINDFRSIRNIFRRITLNSRQIERYNFLEDYHIKHGETPEDIAFKEYGSVSFWWVVLVMNPQIKSSDDWPLLDESLENYLAINYGDTQYDNVEEENDFDLTFIDVDQNIIDHHTFLPDDDTLGTTYQTEVIETNEGARKIKLLSKKHLEAFVKEYEKEASKYLKADLANI